MQNYLAEVVLSSVCNLFVKMLQLLYYYYYYYIILFIYNVYRVRNEEVRRRTGIERELASRADQRVLKWFGHVERMDDYRMARRVLMAEVSGGRVRGRQSLGWMDV